MLCFYFLSSTQACQSRAARRQYGHSRSEKKRNRQRAQAHPDDESDAIKSVKSGLDPLDDDAEASSKSLRNSTVNLNALNEPPRSSAISMTWRATVRTCTYSRRRRSTHAFSTVFRQEFVQVGGWRKRNDVVGRAVRIPC